MKMLNKKNKNKGYIIAYLMIATSVGVTLLTGLIIFTANNQKKSRNDVSRNKALEIAENGVYYYKWYLAHNLDGRTAQQIKNFWQNEDPLGVSEAYENEVIDFTGSAIGKYHIEVTPPDPDSTIVVVTSTGWSYQHPEITKSIRVRFRRPSWSEYSVLANDVMRFGEDTNVFGEIHSNNGIRFDGVANNVVSSSVEEYYDPDTYQVKPGVWTSQSDEDTVFLAGKDFPVTSIDFNSVTGDLSYMKNEAQIEGLFFDEGSCERETNCRWRFGYHYCGGSFLCWSCQTETIDLEGYHIILNTDDTFELREVYDYQGDDWYEDETYKITDEGNPQIYDFPENGLIFLENNVWIEGQIDSIRLTIVSADLSSSKDTNVYINNDILYTNKDGQDTLGIVAENDISIGYYSEDNLEIDAALLAQSGRVGRDHYCCGSYTWRDEITIYGSIATNERYGFAWTDGTGYDIRNLYFDNNLIYYPPPYFPTGTVYELDLWEDL